jgi:D-alanyl-D-alanine carboxypeptidase
MKYKLITLLTFLLLCSEATAQADKVDAYLKSEMTKRHIPGVSLAVVRDGRLILARGYGQADVELSVPVMHDSVFRLASVTKPFTAMAIMMLVEEGKISLDEPVAQYIPDIPSAWGKVTVRQALTHTAGLVDYLRVPGWSWRQELTQAEFLRFTSGAPLLFESGKRIQYSNTGYYLLGILIEKVSGKPYAQFMSERLFKPLQMSATRLDTLSEMVPNRVKGYVFANGMLQNAEYTSLTWAYAEGGIISTAVDLAKWDAALYTEKLVKRASLEQMWTPARLNDGKAAIIGDNGAGKPNYYGLGWYISEYKGHKIILHPGNKPGFSSTFTRFMDDKLTVILLCNSSSENQAFGLSLGVADFYLSEANRGTR